MKYIKKSIDLIMLFLLLFLMGYQFWGAAAHKAAGICMFTFFIVHNVLNYGWYKTLAKGRYTPIRIFHVIINLLLLLSMIGLMVSGIILSNHAFKFLSIEISISFARVLHMVSAYWGLILMAMHIGIHWRIIWNKVKKKIKSNFIKAALEVLSVIIAAYGIYAFIKRKFMSYMFLKTQFVFLNFSESKILFYIDYLCIIEAFIFIPYIFVNILRGRKKNEEV